MPFISYAQNYEDVILWRALGSVKDGYYIDIGAFDPVLHSVSLAFYERGWRGMHVEPLPEFAAKLRLARPDETVIEAAICGDASTIPLHESGGMTTGLAVYARPWAQRIEVTACPLSAIFHKVGDRSIHWLKIDVEGMERSVLESWGQSPARPWVLVIESTRPETQVQTHGDWESEVVRRDYRFAYFDGLNRFYVHQRHLELMGAFGAGPNHFDDFIRHREHMLATQIRKYARERRSMIRKNRRLHRHVRALIRLCRIHDAVRRFMVHRS